MPKKKKKERDLDFIKKKKMSEKYPRIFLEKEIMEIGIFIKTISINR